jgi:ComF family protein
VSTEYAATAKELVHVLKFGRAKAAAEVLAEAISDTLPYLPAETIITFVPSAPSRMRLRGYDHAKLIATTLAKQKNLPCLALLSRQTQVRQVGSTRAARFKQIKGAFRELNPSLIQDSTILLIDDVLTTGATIEEAGQVLKRAGAKQVNAAVFAHKL